MDVFSIFESGAHRVESLGEGIDFATDADIGFRWFFATSDGSCVFGDFTDGAEHPEEEGRDQRKDAGTDKDACGVDSRAAFGDEWEDGGFGFEYR